MTLQRLNSKQVRENLSKLISEAKITEPRLAERLNNLSRWIQDKKDGLLNSKPYVLDFLTELILDSTFWLVLKPLTLLEKKQVYTDMQITPTEQYWFDVLFPQWLNEPDPKLPIWKQEVMKGNFSRDDEHLLRKISQEIERLGGSCLWRHILDLSMATDLLTTGSQGIALSVQITTLSEKYLTAKECDWEKTLTYWGIKRGLLVSYNPMTVDIANRIAMRIFQHSNNLPPSCYTVETA